MIKWLSRLFHRGDAAEPVSEENRAPVQNGPAAAGGKKMEEWLAEGLKLAKDPETHAQAVSCFEMASGMGSAEAQYMLGIANECSFGMREGSSSRAVYYYRLAANRGHVEAQCSLGIMLYEGKGTQQSDSEAEKYFRLAADHGDKTAAFYLNKMAEEGRIKEGYVPKDSAPCPETEVSDSPE